MQKRVIFNDKGLPYLLLAPQLLISVIFFFWPAAQAVQQSLLREDAFGLRSEFVGLENFTEVLTDPFYLNAVSNTVVFSTAVAASAMAVALLLAALADQQIKGARAYRTLLVWPYAIAPAISAVLWLFLFHPSIGIISRMLHGVGVAWDYRLNGAQAMTLVIIASAWKQVSYNFIFFLAALQSIPKSVLDAAAIDGASAWHRFRTIVLPLISPTTFFLLVVNLTYAFFDTFGVIHALTGGGPGKATETLIYKAYADGVQNLNLGSSAAQSVILMVAVIALTMIQFRFIERKVHY